MLTLDKIYHAAFVLKDVARKTDLIEAPKLSKDCQLYLKTENLQVTGSFKVRGAYYKISQLSKEESDKGVIACSAGNHAQGVALAATRRGIKSIVCMPDGAPIMKVENTKNLGAEVCLVPGTYDDAHDRAVELQVDPATPDRAEEYIRAKLARKEKIPGFGHRVYTTEDPRATYCIFDTQAGRLCFQRTSYGVREFRRLVEADAQDSEQLAYVLNLLDNHALPVLHERTNFSASPKPASRPTVRRTLHVPRPQTAPSAITPPNGGCFQSSSVPGVTGTTSWWAISITGARAGSEPAQV